MLNVTQSYLPSKKKYKSYVDDIYSSCHLTNSGPLQKELERRLESYLGVKHVICVANGSVALQVAYKALELRGKVITTPFSFAATSSTLVWEGLEPVYCDIDENTLNLDPNLLESLIDDYTSCILPVHVFGNPCDVENIGKIASEHNLKVIYDAAHAFSVNYLNKSLFSYGDISTVSFHATKIFHTIEGGAIITQCDEIAAKVKRLINFGLEDGKLVDSLGTNAKMNEFEAAMGLCVLDEIEHIKAARRELLLAYNTFLPKYIGRQALISGASELLSYMPVIFKDEKELISVKDALEKNDIYPRRYFYPSLDTIYHTCSMNVQSKSRCVSKRILCLPFYAGMTVEQVKMISAIVSGVLE
ncbi:DegT/DnrJ/EryC1/StrS family aminotransferase [Vibrio alginolyticus]|uniref:DegT/DnrJ/EryC1/StrS family aminotransferase n=1 Tax=Vibrio TaxID=662 RepID=UPI001B8301D8|nr:MULTISPECIES: DegT/DnrJ/EryC1/StrS family aminotransferase [Vibrio]MDW2263278.1 DegT/DnrJ/EryC1/StrS family aminotransferase [Vibrio sp. 1557]HBC3489961.1 DegT/DnrJ/EryC1/StrS family aminotransferase [Vibrio alginolyticus]